MRTKLLYFFLGIISAELADNFCDWLGGHKTLSVAITCGLTSVVMSTIILLLLLLFTNGETKL